MPIKAVFTPPMKAGDSTLMMLLSLNLLLLVFFMMLNTMGIYGAKHAEEVLASVREGYQVQGTPGLKGGVDVPEVPLTAWRAGIASRMQGVTMNRIELKVMTPQQGDANRVEMVMPASAVFGADDKILQPELMRNMAAAAGAESRVTWQVSGPFENAARVGRRVAALAVETGRAEAVPGTEEVVKILVVPGAGTRPEMGLSVQSVGEDAGADVRGVEGKANVRE